MGVTSERRLGKSEENQGTPDQPGPERWVFWTETEGERPWYMKDTGRKWETEKEQPGRWQEPERWVQELPWSSSG